MSNVTSNTHLPGGITFGGKLRYGVVPSLGANPYSSTGTDVIPVIGNTYFADLIIPRDCTVTRLGFLTGNSSNSGARVFMTLMDQQGTIVARTAQAGQTPSSNVNALIDIPLNSTTNIHGPGKFFISLQFNATSARFRAVAASTYPDVLSGMVTSAAGSSGSAGFGQNPNITPTSSMATSFTADQGPFAYVIVQDYVGS